MDQEAAERTIRTLRETLLLSYSQEDVRVIEGYVQHLLLVVASLGAPTHDPLFVEGLRSVATILEVGHGLRKT